VALDQTIEARVVARRVRGEQLVERNAALFIHRASAIEPSARLIEDLPRTELRRRLSQPRVPRGNAAQYRARSADRARPNRT
jgi:hypothetical protein